MLKFVYIVLLSIMTISLFSFFYSFVDDFSKRQVKNLWGLCIAYGFVLPMIVLCFFTL